MQLNFGGLILVAIGVYVLLAAFGVVRVSKNPEANELWLRKFGTIMKVTGPIIVLFGLGQFWGLFR